MLKFVSLLPLQKISAVINQTLLLLFFIVASITAIPVSHTEPVIHRRPMIFNAFAYPGRSGTWQPSRTISSHGKRALNRKTRPALTELVKVSLPSWLAPNTGWCCLQEVYQALPYLERGRIPPANTACTLGSNATGTVARDLTALKANHPDGSPITAVKQATWRKFAAGTTLKYMGRCCREKKKIWKMAGFRRGTAMHRTSLQNLCVPTEIQCIQHR